MGRVHVMFPAKKGERECDVYNNGSSLLEAFQKYCQGCNRGCPMGCIRIKNKEAHMQCFAHWCLSKYRKNVD